MNDFGGSEVWRGVRIMLPLALGDVLDGAAFGALAVSALGPVAPVLMSLTAFSGSAQFAALAVLRAHGTVTAALVAAMALNVRYLAMSAAVSAQMSGPRYRRALACLLLTDAAWAVAERGAREGTRARLIGAGATELSAWTAGTLAGVLAGGVVPDPSRLGLDAAFPALFLWLLCHRIRDRAAVVLALSGGTLALVFTPLTTPGLPVLLAGVFAAVWSLRPVRSLAR